MPVSDLVISLALYVCEFMVSTDNPQSFLITPVGAVRVAKKSAISINVKYQPSATVTGTDVAGKLVVATSGAPELPPWMFYLRGTAEAAPAAAPKPARATSATRTQAPAAAKKK